MTCFRHYNILAKNHSRMMMADWLPHFPTKMTLVRMCTLLSIEKISFLYQLSLSLNLKLSNIHKKQSEYSHILKQPRCIQVCLLETTGVVTFTLKYKHKSQSFEMPIVLHFSVLLQMTQLKRLICVLFCFSTRWQLATGVRFLVSSEHSMSDSHGQVLLYSKSYCTVP